MVLINIYDLIAKAQELDSRMLEIEKGDFLGHPFRGNQFVNRVLRLQGRTFSDLEEKKNTYYQLLRRRGIKHKVARAIAIADDKKRKASPLHYQQKDSRRAVALETSQSGTRLNSVVSSYA